MTLAEFLLLMGIAGCAGVGASGVLSTMIDRIGRTPAPQRVMARDAARGD